MSLTKVFRVTTAIKPVVVFYRFASTARHIRTEHLSSFTSSVEKTVQAERLNRIATKLRKLTLVTDENLPPLVLVPSLSEMMVDEHGLMLDKATWDQTVTTMAIHARCGIPIAPEDVQTFNSWKFEPHLIALFIKKRDAEKKLLNLIRRTVD